MNSIEKLGLLLLICGINMLTGLFILGGGDAWVGAKECNNSVTLPLIFIFVGVIAFMAVHRIDK
jgi:hypothetical protein